MIHTNGKTFITMYDDVRDVGEKCNSLLYLIALAALTCQKWMNDVPWPSAISRPEECGFGRGAPLLLQHHCIACVFWDKVKKMLPMQY
jgi:hypothetical protein